MSNPDGKSVFKLTVEGTSIEEVYAFDDNPSIDEVKTLWYWHMRDNAGVALAKEYRPRIRCKQLTEDDPQFEDYKDEQQTEF